MIRYIFREDEPLRIKAAKQADPQVIGEALEGIREAAGGELVPQDVVDVAREKGHPLHDHFEWDDSAAAEAYRLDQARSIIRLIRVVDRSMESGTARAFISVRADSGVSYRSVSDVKSSDELRQLVLAQADRDLEAFKKRYAELKEICAIVETARVALRRRRKGKINPENRAT